MTKPALIIKVVYKSTNQSNWRGFCVPYDVTCEAENKNEAIKRLEMLVKLYESGLENYRFPRHLINKQLSDKEDQRVFKIAWGKIKEDIEKHRLRSYSDYVKTSTERDLKINNFQSSISYRDTRVFQPA